MKMKYDCPPASVFGKDPPLWKSATTNFLRVVKECAVGMTKHRGGEFCRYFESREPPVKCVSAISDKRIQGIWQSVLDVARGAILADWSVIPPFPPLSFFVAVALRSLFRWRGHIRKQLGGRVYDARGTSSRREFRLQFAWVAGD